MDKAIRIKIKKELTSQQEKKVIQLKGALIAGAYTDIIHISDEGEEFYINHFITSPAKKAEVLDFITAYLEQQSLDGAIWIL